MDNFNLQVISGDANAVQKLIQDLSWETGYCSFNQYLSCMPDNKRDDFLELLINCDEKTYRENKALYEKLLLWGVEEGNVVLVKKLLANQIDVNFKDKNGFTPLYIATKKDNDTMFMKSFNLFGDVWYNSNAYCNLIDLLLCNGADMDEVCVKGETPWQLAVRAENIDVLNVYASHSSNLKGVDRSLLLPAVREGKAALVGLILDQCGKDEHHWSLWSLVNFAITHGHFNVVQLLLCRRDDLGVTIEKDTSLLLFVCKSLLGMQRNRLSDDSLLVNVVQMLLEGGADINKQDVAGMSALHYATKIMNFSLVKKLLNQGADPNLVDLGGNTPLHLALSNFSPLNMTTCYKRVNLNVSNLQNMILPNDQYEVVDSLLSFNACMYTKNKLLESPLEKVIGIAISNDDMKLMHLFVGYNANFNLIDAHGKTPLINFVLSNKTEMISYLLMIGVDVNFTDHAGMSPLHHAVSLGKVETVMELLSSGIDMNIKAKDGNTALHTACLCKNKVFEAILNYGAEVNVGNNEGQTPLFIAVDLGDIEKVKMLLHKGANPNILNNQGKSCLFLAGSHEGLWRTLLSSGASPNVQDNEGKTVLHHVVKNQSISLVRVLLEYNTELNIIDNLGNTCLHSSFENSFQTLELVDLLLAHGVKVNSRNSQGDTALHLAIRRDYDQLKSHEMNYWGKSLSLLGLKTAEQITKSLLNYGADINIANNDKETPLFWAAQMGMVNLVDMFLKHGVEVSELNRMALYIALKNRSGQSRTIVEKLLNYGFSIDSQDVDKEWILISSTEKLIFPIVEKLLDFGASVDKTDSEGRSPLHMTVSWRMSSGNLQIDSSTYRPLCYRVAELLLARGAQVNAVTLEGETPLHYAVKAGVEEVVQLLLEHGANVNLSDLKGVTPLHLNSVQGSVKIFELLVKYDALVNCVQGFGRTPLHLAVENNNTQMVDLLLECGAKIEAPDIIGNRPLHCLNSDNSVDVFIKLMKYYPNIDAQNKAGCTPLHIACLKGCPEVISKFLDHGANCEIYNYDYRKPYDLIMQRADMPKIFRSTFNQLPHCVNAYNAFSIWSNLKDSFKDHFEKIKTAQQFKDIFILKERNCERFGYVHKHHLALIEELKRMSSENVGHSHVTFFEFMSFDIKRLSTFLENKEICKVLSKFKYKYKFPLYGSMLFAQYWKGMRWRKLINYTKDYLRDVFDGLPVLPIECIETLIDYLNENDIKQIGDFIES